MNYKEIIKKRKKNFKNLKEFIMKKDNKKEGKEKEFCKS